MTTSNNRLLKIPAVWMRDGTSKGLFFHATDLPKDEQLCECYLLAAIGSPDGFGRQLNGVGGATSSTSRVVIISPSDDPAYDVNYLFGHVSIAGAIIDWSGNCGNFGTHDTNSKTLNGRIGLFASVCSRIKH